MIIVSRINLCAANDRDKVKIYTYLEYNIAKREIGKIFFNNHFTKKMFDKILDAGYIYVYEDEVFSVQTVTNGLIAVHDIPRCDFEPSEFKLSVDDVEEIFNDDDEIKEDDEFEETDTSDDEDS